MRSQELAVRNVKEVWRDPLAVGLTIGLPLLMLLVMQSFGEFEDIFSPTNLAPGVALFGFVMLMFSAAMILARDRETALFSRLLTSPLRPNEFVTAYSLPYLPVAVVQALVVYGVAALLGMRIAGNPLLVVGLLTVMAILFISLGMLLGALFSSNQVPFVYMAILLLVVFGGAWINVQAIGGTLEVVADLFPFAHSLYALRGVMADGAGLADIAGDVAWVLAYTALSTVAAAAAFRRRMRG